MEPDRLAAFVAARATDLNDALSIAHRQGLPEGYVPWEHLAKNVSWSLAVQRQRKMAAWDLNTHWSSMIRQGRFTDSTVLSDFVWSLACDQLPQFQVPQFRPEIAETCCSGVYERDVPKVARSLHHALPDLGDEGHGIATAAFAVTFMGYWSGDSVERRDKNKGGFKRLNGSSRISTFVGMVARSLARDSMKERESSARVDAVLEPIAPQPSTDDSFRKALHECIELLPARRRLVLTLVRLEEQAPSKVAEVLGIGRSAVSNHLKRAQGDLRNCLRDKGFEEELAGLEDFE